MHNIVPLRIKLAAEVLKSGGLIAYPTEGTWGLGCDPNNKNALLRLLSLKGRQPDKGLILVAASQQQFSPYLDGLKSQYLAKLGRSWPGPITWLVPDNGTASPLVKGSFSSVALRVSAHTLVVQLCLEFGGPVVSTSANFAGAQSARWPWQVQKQLGYGLDYLLHGSLGGAKRPSQIKDLITDKVLRQG